MADDQQIAAAASRVAAAFRKKPELALDSNHTSCVLHDGLKCEVREGDHRLVADMGPVMGGEGHGPTPGFYGRAALISCIAIGLKMTAARHSVAIDSIRVEVENDWDNRGMFAMDGALARALAFRVTIDIKSNAEPHALQAVIDEGLATDAWLQTFVAPYDITPVVRINGADAPAEG